MSFTATEGTELLQSLNGRWKPVYQEVDGQMVEPSITASTTLELTGNDFKVEKDGVVSYEGIFTIEPLASPKQVTLIYRKSTNPIFLGGPRPGVFQVEADTLKWCFGGVGHSAPKSLNTYPGSESVLSIYQREASSVPRPFTTFLRSAPPW
jgi:uncharacterized protein (TIGR03067 family)